MNDGYRSTNIPAEIQTSLDAANARADKAEARADEAEALLRDRLFKPIKIIFVCLVYSLFTNVIWNFIVGEHEIRHQATLTTTEVVPQPTAVTPITIPGARVRVVVNVPTDRMGYTRLETFDCRTGRTHTLLDTPDPAHMGVAIYDDVSSRLVRGCGPSPLAVTVQLQRLDVRLSSVERTRDRYRAYIP